MSSTTNFIFQFAEAVSAISLPVGGGLAAYAKWRRNAERDRTARQEAARIASERAASEARKEEQSMRDKLLKEKDDRIELLNKEVTEVRAENDRLHNTIVKMLNQGLKLAEGGHDDGSK